MFKEVAAADIDEESELRAEVGDVGVVLVGADAEIDAAAREGAEMAGDGEESGLVRDEVVGVEVAFGLGELGDESGEFGAVEGAGGKTKQSEDGQEGSQTPHDLLS
jgi:hypothetical protein